MHTFIAIAILVGSAFLGIVIFKRGTAALFCPRSRVSQWILGTIVLASLVVSLGVLTFGGWWSDLLSWCGLLLCAYYCIKGSLLLMQSPNGPACRNDGTGDAE